MSGLREVVKAFLDQREEYVRVLKQCVDADSDYYRWSGNAEARRHLGEKLVAAGIDLTVEPTPVSDRQTVIDLLASTVFHCADDEEFGLNAKHAAAVTDALLSAGVFRDEPTPPVSRGNFDARSTVFQS